MSIKIPIMLPSGTKLVATGDAVNFIFASSELS